VNPPDGRLRDRGGGRGTDGGACVDIKRISNGSWKSTTAKPMMQNLISAIAIAAAFASGLGAESRALFSESFESGKLDPAIWDVRTMGAATVAVEPVEGAHGKYALHAHYPEMTRRLRDGDSHPSA
jgi:hypothetical protein